MKILSMHDLGENGHNQIYDELLKYFPEDQIKSRAYDLIKENPAEIMMDCLLGGPYDLIVGKGFGAILALILGANLRTKTVLINPMYPIQNYLAAELPDYKYDDNLIRREHNNLCWYLFEPSHKNISLILSEDDDIVDTKRVASYFPVSNIYYVRGGHSPQGDDFASTFEKAISENIGSNSESVAKEDDHEGLGMPSKALSSNEDQCFAGNSDNVAARQEFASRYENMRIDEVDMSNGNFLIRWSLPDADPGTHTLYLYFENGRWWRDNEDGLCDDPCPSTVLRKASEAIIDQSMVAKHDAQRFTWWYC